MLSEITAKELKEWIDYAELEPFGPLHDSRRAAVMAMAMLAPWQEKGKDTKPEELFPELREKAGKKTDVWFTGEDMVMAGKALCLAYGGEIK